MFYGTFNNISAI